MKRILILAAGLLLALPLALPGHSYAQPLDRGAVVAAFDAATNAASVNTALALFAPAATVVELPTPPPPDLGKFAGTDQIRGWLQLSADEHTHVQALSPAQVAGDTVTEQIQIAIDPWRGLGIAPLEATDVVVVQNGQIQSLTSTLTPSSVARLQAAYAAGGPPGMPRTGQGSAVVGAGAALITLVILVAGLFLRRRAATR